MNEMQLRFPAKSENEIFARNAVAAFALALDPSLSELSDIKTAVSEAVTNCIVHGYRGTEGWVTVNCRIIDAALTVEVIDEGAGIEDVEKALTPFYTSAPEEERSGMGFTIMQTFMSEFAVTSEKGVGTRVVMRKIFGERKTDAV